MRAWPRPRMRLRGPIHEGRPILSREFKPGHAKRSLIRGSPDQRRTRQRGPRRRSDWPLGTTASIPSTCAAACAGKMRNWRLHRHSWPAVRAPGLEPLVILDEPIRTSTAPTGARADTRSRAATPDEAVYLPGRNLLLTVKAAAWCRLRGVTAGRLAPWGRTPSHSTPGFFRDLERCWVGRLRLPELTRPFGSLTSTR